MDVAWSRRNVLCAAGAATLPVIGAACTDRPAPPPDNTFVIRGARIFDGTRLTEVDSVLVEQGTITAMGRNIATPNSAAVHAGTGRTLLPGLIDSHVHAWDKRTPYGPTFGVTTMLDMFAPISMLPEFRRQRMSRDRAVNADIWSAGTLITAPGGHGTQFGVPIPTLDQGTDPAAFVQARLDEGADYIKIVIEDGSLYGLSFPTLTAEQVNALVAAAHARSVRAVVHVSTAKGAAIAAAAGAELLAHVPSQRIDQRLADTIKRQNMAVVTTLTVIAAASCGDEATALSKDPRIEGHLLPEQRNQLTNTFPTCMPPLLDNALTNVTTLRQAGVPILAGTDAANPGTTFGASLHSELELLVRAGLSPAEALAAATSLPAQRFDLADRGQLAPGRRADLILVDGNPTEDITATRNIATIWKNGYQIPR